MDSQPTGGNLLKPLNIVQGTFREFRVTFVSQEKLGVLFDRISQLDTHPRKKERAAEINWIDNTLRRLGLIPSGAEWATYAVAVGVDFSGNLGVFVLQDPVEIIKK